MSAELIRRQHENGNKERDRAMLKQVMESKIRESKYNERYKWIRVEGTAKYLEKKGERENDCTHGMWEHRGME